MQLSPNNPISLIYNISHLSNTNVTCITRRRSIFHQPNAKDSMVPTPLDKASIIRHRHHNHNFNLRPHPLRTSEYIRVME